MPHNIFHGQPFNPFGLLSDAAQDYLSGDLPAARGRPFLPGMTVNPVTGDRMTNRERIEMNRAARQGLLSPDRFGRVRPSRVDNFMGLPVQINIFATLVLGRIITLVTTTPFSFVFASSSHTSQS